MEKLTINRTKNVHIRQKLHNKLDIHTPGDAAVQQPQKCPGGDSLLRVMAPRHAQPSLPLQVQVVPPRALVAPRVLVPQHVKSLEYAPCHSSKQKRIQVKRTLWLMPKLHHIFYGGD